MITTFLLLASVKAKSSAEDSQFLIGDIITQIGGELIAGLPPFEAFIKSFGTVGTEVEIVASRMEDGVKKRIQDFIVRDQFAPPLKAHLGEKSMLANVAVYDASLLDL